MSNFTNSPLVATTILSPNRNTPRNQQISKVTIHHFAGRATARNVGNLLFNSARQASYNYGVDANEIVLYVDESNRSWASSSPANDHQAVTIGVANSELAPTWAINDRAWDAMIDLCVDIVRRNPGITRRDGRSGLWFDGTQNGSLTFHDMFTATACPGPFIRSRAQQICNEVNARLDKSTGNRLKNGWVQSNGNWSFYVNGQRQTRWLQHNRRWYFLNNQGIMRDGWLQNRGHWYFLNPRRGQDGQTSDRPHGAMRDGWVETGADRWYFLNPQSGHRNHNSKLPHGAMWNTDGVINGVSHRFNSSGRWLGEE